MMVIPQSQPLGMARTQAAHTAVANGSIRPEGLLTNPDNGLGTPMNNLPSAAQNTTDAAGKSFADYMVGAVSSMNDQQLAVTDLEKRVMTDPDSVDPQDVTIAMAKARMSLNLAQSVIDRLITDWNEITTTR